MAAATPSRSERRNSLLYRSFCGIALLASLTWLLLTLVIVWLVRHEAARMFDDSLRELAHVVLAFSHDELQEIEHARGDPVGEDIESAQNGTLHYQIWDRAGVLKLRSAHAPTRPLASAASGFTDVEIGGVRMRAYAVWNADHTYQLQMVELPREREAYALHVSVFTGVAMLLTLAVFLLLLRRRLRLAFESVERTAGELAGRQPADLSPVEAGDKPLELRPMIEAFNALLERIRRAMQHEQRFTSDAAHELKTPLAGLKILLRNAERAPDAAERQQALQQMSQALDRASQLVDQLLALARYDHDPSAFDLRQAIDLDTLAWSVVQELQPLAQERQVAVRVLSIPDIRLLGHGNREALAVLLRNMLENALRHAPAGGRVEIVLCQPEPAGPLELQVHDDGPGVPPELRSRVFARFFRAARHASPGVGLGLAIVQRIAELHGGTADIGASDRLPGAMVRVRLPARAEARDAA